MKLMKALRLLFILPLLLTACKDKEAFVQIKSSENLLYQEIRDYRNSQGLKGSFTHQFILVGEAQIYSYKMANGAVEPGTEGLAEHWLKLNEKWNFYNQAALILKSDLSAPSSVFNRILELPGADSVLLAEVNQCGVGIESDASGMNYVTILLAKADS
ncbi:MAG: hypothetical protein CSA96_10435 [Bacteroidetes bacterium]|nr:MAG: hypothetical protein CSA96_10435 [Bacteroidota bacterium]